MKVGGDLGSEGMLLSVLRVGACSRVSGYPSLEKKMRFFDAQGCHCGASDRMWCCRST